MKICYRCKKEKKLSEFGASKRVKDGKRGDCKECRKLLYNLNKNIILEKKKPFHIFLRLLLYQENGLKIY